MLPNDISFAYYSSEGQVSQTVRAQKQVSTSALYDLLIGCFHNINVDSYKVYVKGNNESEDFQQGEMRVHKEFVDGKNPIATQTIGFADFNSAGANGVEVFDFNNTIDAKVILKIEIISDFSTDAPEPPPEP